MLSGNKEHIASASRYRQVGDEQRLRIHFPINWNYEELSEAVYVDIAWCETRLLRIETRTCIVVVPREYVASGLRWRSRRGRRRIRIRVLVAGATACNQQGNQQYGKASEK